MRFTKWDYLAFPFLAALRDGAHSGQPTVLAEQFKARDRMSRAEKAALAAEKASRLQPLFVAQIIATGFVILGFGLHFLL